ARARGYRSMLVGPMFREDTIIGLITVTRCEPGPFAAGEIALLQTFADQGVIAIENVRLFTEMQEKNPTLTETHSQVTESLEPQPATSEILRVISSWPTEVQPVFEAVAQNSARLCEAPDVVIVRVDGDVLRWVTSVGPFGETIAPDTRIPITRGSV